MVAAAVFDDDVAFSETFLRVLTKDMQLVPLRLNRVQRDYLARRSNRDLILKARQMGLTTVIQARLFRKAITGTTKAVTFANDDDLTQSIRRTVKRFYDNLPVPDSQRPQRKYDNARVMTFPDFDSELLIATAGTKSAKRGNTVSEFHGTEVAYWKDAQAIVSGAMQAGNLNAVLESTANGAQGYFYTLCMEALDGNSDWKLHFYPWWWDRDYQLPLEADEVIAFDDEETQLVVKHRLTPEQIKWRRAKKREVKQQFPQEYPEDALTCFLRSGFGWFGDIEFAFSAPLAATPHADHRYVAGLDWGQTSDYTTLVVIDATAGVQADLLRINQMSWGDMRRRIVQKLKHWNCAVLVPERNSMGSTNIEELAKDIRQAKCATRIYADADGVFGFNTTNDSKYELMSALYEDLHSGSLRLQPHATQKHEFGAFIAKQLPSGAWRLEGKDGEHDDTVIGAALANKARRVGGLKLRFG